MAPARKTTTKPRTETAKEKAEKARSAAAQSRDKKQRKLWSLVLFSVGILLIVFSFVGDIDAENKNAADQINTFLRGMFGFSVFFIGPILIYISVMISMNKGKGSVAAKLVQLGLIILLISAGIQIVFYGSLEDLSGGGRLSYVLGWVLLRFGNPTASIIVILIAFVVFMLASDITLHEFLKMIAKPFRFIGSKIKAKSQQLREDSEYIRLLNEENKKLDEQAAVASTSKTNEKTPEEINLEKRLKFASIEAAASSGREPSNAAPEAASHKDFHEELTAYIAGEERVGDADPGAPEDETEENDGFFKAVGEYIKEKEEQNAENEKNNQTLNFSQKKSEAVQEEKHTENETLKEQYALPPVNLLNEPIPVQSTLDIQTELDQNSNTLVETLKSFGVQTKIVGVCRGPSVTRYELQPAAGVKISKITGLIDDIALNLATAGVRIEAPIPNKPAVGIEVPNRTTDTVHIRSL